MPRPLRTDIVIVTYNSALVIEACLRSLRPVHAMGASVTVVDNASTDGTVSVARKSDWAEVVANSTNAGFAGGVNQAARGGHGRYILLLNPDTELLTPDLLQLEADCETYGLASGVLLDEKAGQPQKGFFARRLPTAAALSFEALGLNRLWPSNPVNRSYRCYDFPGGEAGFIEQPPGAFLMIRRDVWEQLGGMDETFYPVWFEDTDLCKRALSAGYRVRYSPESKVLHQGGHSVLQVHESARAMFWYGSLLRYAGKHFGTIRFGIVCTAVAMGAAARALVAGTLGDRAKSKNPKGDSIRTYGTIMRLAVQSLMAGKVAPTDVALQANAKSVVSAVRQ